MQTIPACMGNCQFSQPNFKLFATLIDEASLGKEEELTESVSLMIFHWSEIGQNVNKNKLCFGCEKLGELKCQCRNIQCI